MHKLRENPPLDFNGIKTTLIEDYQTSQRKDLTNNTNSALSIPSSNVLIFYLEDGTKIAARPSGTEPKIKFYISVNTTVNTTEQLATKQNELTKKIQAISAFFNAY